MAKSKFRVICGVEMYVTQREIEAAEPCCGMYIKVCKKFGLVPGKRYLSNWGNAKDKASIQKFCKGRRATNPNRKFDFFSIPTKEWREWVLENVRRISAVNRGTVESTPEMKAISDQLAFLNKVLQPLRDQYRDLEDAETDKFQASLYEGAR